MLGDTDPTVRWWAVYWLCMLGVRSAVPAIARLLKADPDELVRSFAAYTLGELGDSSVLPALEDTATNDRGADHEGVPNSKTARLAIQKIILRAGA